MRIQLVFGVATALICVGSLHAVAQQATPNAPAPPTPVINRGGGIAGTGLGAGSGAAGTTGAVVGNKARSPAMVSGVAHIGAGTGGLGLGMGNATGGVVATAIGAAAGGVNDTGDWGTRTGGVNGAGRGLGAGSGGINDSAALGAGINTGGVHGSAIGAGTGGLADLNSLGASTGGAHEGNNAPRYRVVQ